MLKLVDPETHAFFRIGKKGGRCKFLGLLVSPPHCPPRIGNETCVTESEKSGTATSNCQNIFRKTTNSLLLMAVWKILHQSRVDHWFYHLLQVQLPKLQQRGVKLYWDGSYVELRNSFLLFKAAGAFYLREHLLYIYLYLYIYIYLISFDYLSIYIYNYCICPHICIASEYIDIISTSPFISCRVSTSMSVVVNIEEHQNACNLSTVAVTFKENTRISNDLKLPRFRSASEYLFQLIFAEYCTFNAFIWWISVFPLKKKQPLGFGSHLFM